MKKILIIEDDDNIIRMIKMVMKRMVTEGKFELTFAKSLKEAEEKLDNQNYFDVVAIDGSLEARGGAPDTHHLIVKTQTYQQNAVIITISSSENTRKEALAIGCHHEADKSGLYQLLTSIV